MRQHATGAAEEEVPGDLLSARQACRLLAISRATLWRWRRAGLLRCWRVPGGGLRLSRAEVVALLAPAGASRGEEG